MDVNPANTIAQTHPDGRKAPHGGEHKSEMLDQKEDNDAESGSWREEGAVEFDHGLIDSLTPEVQSIINALTQEIEPLRNKLVAAEARAENFKKAAAQHPFLSVPNRNEILRELRHVIAHRAVLTEPPVLVLLHVSNADQVRRDFGRQALDQYLVEICKRVMENIPSTDAFGCLGGNDFALLVLGVAYIEARQFTRELIGLVCSEPVMIDGKAVEVEFVFGATDLLENVTSTDAVARADADMRALALGN